MGASFDATRVVLRESTSVTIIIVRFALGLVVLVSIVILNKEWSPDSELSAIQRRDWSWFLFLGFYGSFVHQVLHVNCLASTSAINRAFFDLGKRVLDRHTPSFMMTITMGLGWLMLLPLSIGSTGRQEMSGMSIEGWSALLFLRLFCSPVVYVFWYDALDAAGAGQMASFLYLEPPVTLVAAVLLLHETLALGSHLRGSLILAGVWLVNHRCIHLPTGTKGLDGVK